MCRYINACIHGWGGAWMDVCMDELMDSRSGFLNTCVADLDAWIDGCMWIYGLIDGWRHEEMKEGESEGMK